MLGALNAERVRVLRPKLLVLAVLVNAFGVMAAFVQHEALVTLYIFGVSIVRCLLGDRFL